MAKEQFSNVSDFDEAPDAGGRVFDGPLSGPWEVLATGKAEIPKAQLPDQETNSDRRTIGFNDPTDYLSA